MWLGESQRHLRTCTLAENVEKVEMLFAHLKRILKLDRLRLRGMSDATDEFTLATAVQNLCRLLRASQSPWPVPQHAGLLVIEDFTDPHHRCSRYHLR
jgi:hypothetical protein